MKIIRQPAILRTSQLNRDLREDLDDLEDMAAEDSAVAIQPEGKDGPTVAVTYTGKDTTPGAEPKSTKDALLIKNALTNLLDEAYSEAQHDAKYNRSHANNNVLVTGLPGSSKTRSLENWARGNGINLVKIDAKNPDLDVLISGASALDLSDPKNPTVKKAYSNLTRQLTRPNSVLFLDELNRQTKEYLRGSLLSVVADKEIPVAYDTEADKEVMFDLNKTLLFTVACINPPSAAEKAAMRLGGAERRRYYYWIDFNSTAPTALEYVKGFYNNEIKKLVTDFKDDPDYKPELERLVKAQFIGRVILGSPDFHFDEYDDAEEANANDRKLLAQSTLTELIYKGKGDLNKTIREIERSHLLDKNIEMLKNILETDPLLHPMPDIHVLIKAAEKEIEIKIPYDDIDVPDTTTAETKPTSGSVKSALDFEDDEIEAELAKGTAEDDPDFATPAGVSAERIAASKMSPAETRAKVLKGLAGF